MSASYSIGWDVGGWNCDGNRRSRDAIVILDSALNVVGKPYRGNLRECISAANTTSDWLQALFAKCDAKLPEGMPSVVMGIDAALGFSDEFIGLVTRQGCVEPNDVSGMNPYLFRYTERHLFARGWRPLSPVKDMIGSQATKAMHVLAKFAPEVESCGVWTDKHGFRVIETYPTVCRETAVVKKLLAGCRPLGDDDRDDALVCAAIAHLFATDRGSLEVPDHHVSQNEGWIWVSRTGGVQ